MNILNDSWQHVTGGQPRKTEFIDLVCRYSDTQRRYHSLEHVRDMLHGLHQTDQWTDTALQRAVWWHDAIYDSTRSDNEKRSAELAARTLSAWKVSPAEIARVAALIPVRLFDSFPMPRCACYRIRQSGQPIAGSGFAFNSSKQEYYFGLHPGVARCVG